jgi:hypothetical protein
VKDSDKINNVHAIISMIFRNPEKLLDQEGIK